MEYVKIWLTQSQLLWSRLQSAAVLHSAVLVGWFKLDATSHPNLARLLLALGITISVFLTAIMVRDAQYMDAMKRRAEADGSFPATGSDAPSGRWCGYAILALLTLAEIVLLIRPCLKA